MTHSESWNTFIDELRTYVQEHHHFPNKHTRLLSRVKYTRKKINDGTLEEWKKKQFLEVADMRDMEEHCGGKKEIRNLGSWKHKDYERKSRENGRDCRGDCSAFMLNEVEAPAR